MKIPYLHALLSVMLPLVVAIYTTPDCKTTQHSCARKTFITKTSSTLHSTTPANSKKSSPTAEAKPSSGIFSKKSSSPPQKSSFSVKSTSSLKLLTLTRFSTCTKSLSSSKALKAATSSPTSAAPFTSEITVTSVVSIHNPSSVPSVSPSGSSAPSTTDTSTVASVPAPLSSASIAPACTPKTSKAVKNGGFADKANGYKFSLGSDGGKAKHLISPYYGVSTDVGNTYSLIVTNSDASVNRLNVSQTVCLIPGTRYTYSYYTGRQGRVGSYAGLICTIGLNANGKTLRPAAPACASQTVWAFSTHIGTCSIPSTNFDRDHPVFYEHISGVYIPTTAEVTLEVIFACDSKQGGVYAYFDHLSIKPENVMSSEKWYSSVT